MKKLISVNVSIILIIIMLFGLFSTAEAIDYECGPNATWAYKNYTITISGSGKMYNYDGMDMPWQSIKRIFTHIIIEEGITTIGEKAFWNAENATDISLPSTLKAIGKSALSYTAISEVFIPTGVTSIGDQAFFHSGVKTLSIPSTIEFTSDNYFCFAEMGKLTYLYYRGSQAEWENSLSKLTNTQKRRILKDIENAELIFVKDVIIPSAGVKDFVRRCYKLILNREADEGGLKGWSEALASKTSAAANIIDGFVKSDEFMNRKLSDEAKVDILYKTMLNREADAGGKAGWVDALSKGYTLQNIIDGFCGSAEFTAMCKDYGIEPGSVGAAAPTDTSTPRGKIEAFVKRCYQLILNRQADEGGLKGWSDALEGKTAAAAQIIDGFVRSPEYINRSLTNDQSVTILYKTMLDREPDAAGKAGWVDALSKGYTLQHIINGFCGSAEFTKICSDYGIQAGSVAVPARASVALEAAAQLEAKKLPDERIGNAVSADDAGIAVVNGYEPAEVEAFVKHAYRAALGREADEAGLASWTEQIVSGAVAPKAFLRTLLGSNEFAARNLSSEALVETLYRLYLNRGMDDAAADRVAQLAAGGLEEVIKGFEGSAEFRLVLNSFGL